MLIKILFLISLNLSSFALDVWQISNGNYHTVAITVDSTLWTWGQNGSGQLGNGTTGHAFNKSIPQQIGTKKYISIKTGYNHSVAIAADSTLWTWGSNHSGQLGDSTNTTQNTPQQIGNKKYIKINTGNFHTVAIAADSTLWTWGRNYFGQLGNGTNGNGSDKNTPQQIGNKKYIELYVGNQNTMALAADSTFWAWGWNAYGQFGDSTNSNKNTPTQIEIPKFIKINKGGNHTIAIAKDSTLWTWGFNNKGQLGDSTNGSGSHKNTPTKIGTRKYIGINAGDNHTVAIAADSTLWAWGINKYGQLGDNTNGDDSDKNTPTQIGTKKYIGINAGQNHTVAIASDNTLWAWGANTYGQLGDSTKISSPVPILILIGKQTPKIYSATPDQKKEPNFKEYNIDLKNVFEDVETSDESLIYSVNGNNNLTIGITNGIAKISSIKDREGIDTLIFSAEDEDGLFAYDTVLFTILSTNNAPLFLKESYAFKIPEEAVHLPIIGPIEAYDKDNDTLSYTILSGDPTSTFSYQVQTSSLQREKKLNYATQSSYSISLEVSDNANPPLKDTTQISILVVREVTTNISKSILGETSISQLQSQLGELSFRVNTSVETIEVINTLGVNIWKMQKPLKIGSTVTIQSQQLQQGIFILRWLRNAHWQSEIITIQ